MGYKLYKFCENRARDTALRGIYTPHFYQMSVKISVLGSYTRIIAPPCQISPHQCIVSSLGEKPQNRPLSNLNTGALRNAAGKNLLKLK